MMDTLSIALSGLTAQGQRLSVSASNIANISTAGVLPTAASPNSTVYKPLSVSYVALTAGGSGAGLKSVVTENKDGISSVYSPDSIYANKDGLIAVPNISLEKEIMDALQARLLYKANTASVKACREMSGQLINSIT